jgi:integrase
VRRVKTELDAEGHRVSLRKLARWLEVPWSTVQYKPGKRKPPEVDKRVEAAIYELIQRYPRYGYRRIAVMLRRTKDLLVNRKKVQRIMRRSEILTLTWDKVDMARRVINLEAGDTNDREPRMIPICRELHDILKSVPKALHDDHVFLYKGNPVKSIKTGLIRVCRDAGINYGRFVKGGFIFHDLRHCFNTYMRKSGVSESAIMEITGHSTSTTLQK